MLRYQDRSCKAETVFFFCLQVEILTFGFAKMRLKMFVNALFYALTKRCTPFVNADLPFQQTRRDKLAIQ